VPKRLRLGFHVLAASMAPLLVGLLAQTTTTLSGADAPDSAYAAAVRADNPLGYWRLGDSGTGTAADASEQGHTATIFGGVVPATPGALHNDPQTASTFDGSTGYVQDTQPLAVGPDVTLEAWVKAPVASAGPIVAIDAGDQQTRMLYLEGGRLSGRASLRADWPAFAVQSRALDPTVWHHVVFVTHATNMLTLYVDGALAASATAPGGTSFGGTVSIGWSGAQWLPHFAGTVQEVAVYGAALSPARILAHFQAGGTPCAASLQAQVDAAQPGSTVSVPPCVYRETVTISKPLTLAGQSGAEIRGSDIWTNWTQTGSYWSAGPVPVLPVYNDPSRCADASNNRCLHAEQVFLDGKPLQWVAANPRAGQFVLDGQRNVLLADNPNGHTVEVTTRARWIVTASDHVTIQGLTMRDAGNDALTGAVSNDGYSDWAIQDSVLSDAHGALVSIHAGTNLRVLRDDLGRAGQQALHGDLVTQGLIQDNHIHDGNTDQFDPVWGAGGVKLTQQRGVVVDGNEVDHNLGPGLWSDVQSHDVTYSSNRVHDNRGAGIIFEVSDGASIHDNAAWNNGWGNASWGWGAGILISTAADAEVSNNTLAWNAAGVSVVEQKRDDAVTTNNVFVHDNVIVASDGALALSWLSDHSRLFDPGSNNRGAHNRYWYTSDEGDKNRFAWDGWRRRLADLNNTPGDSNGQYLAGSDKDSLLAAKGIPSSPPSH
jgi:nitrous oxidase accessory protein NosD